MRDVEYGHPDFGKLIPCECVREEWAREREIKRKAALRRICGLYGEMLAWTFENTPRARPDCPTYAAAYDLAKERAQNPEWLMALSGSYGVGKTRLLSCIVNAGMAADLSSVYTTMAELLDHLRAAFGPHAETGYDELWDTVVNARILAIDEVDRFSATEWAEEKYFQLIELRYRAGEDRLTVIATNKDIKDLPGYVQSRLYDRHCSAFVLKGADMRRVRK